MRKQYAILVDAIRNEQYGYVIKSAEDVEFFGFNDNSNEWAKWANDQKLNLNQLPSGIGVGEFRPLTKSLELMSKSGQGWSFVRPSSSADKRRVVTERQRFDTSSLLPSCYDGLISRVHRNTSIRFKARAFQTEIQVSQLAKAHRRGRIAFNFDTHTFVGRPSIEHRDIHDVNQRHNLSGAAGRKFGLKIVEQLNHSSIPADESPEVIDSFIPGFSKVGWLNSRKHRGASFKKQFEPFEAGAGETKWFFDVITAFARRSLTNRRKGKKRKRKSFIQRKSFIPDSLNEKALGRRIGYGVANAARGLRGRGRGLSRALSRIEGVLDPRKRRDSDNDGMIFDGTWREMPDPKRFLEFDLPERDDPEGMRSMSRRGRDGAEFKETYDMVRGVWEDTSMGGADADTGFRAVARELGLDKENTEEFSKLAYQIGRMSPDDIFKKYDNVDSAADELAKPVTSKLSDGPRRRGQEEKIRTAVAAFLDAEIEDGKIVASEGNLRSMSRRARTDARANNFASIANISRPNRSARTEGRLRSSSRRGEDDVDGDVELGSPAGGGDYLAQLLDATNTRSENELFAYLRNTKLKRERYKTTDPKKWNNEDIYNARTHGKMSLQQVAEQMGLDRTEVRTREQKHMRSLRNLAKQRLIERAVDNELLDTEAPEERRRAVPRKLIDSDLSLRLEMRRKKIRDSEPEIYEEFYRLLAERAGTRVDPEQANKNISEILSILAEKYDTYPSRIRRAVVKHGQSLRQGLELESSDSPDVKPIRSQSRRSQVAQMSPSARRMSAVSRQAADIPGFQSRSRRSRDARGGERAVSELDGQLYKSLSTEEQAKIPEEVAKLREETQRALKEIFRAYWRGQVGGASVEGYVGTRRARQRPEDDKLTTADIVEMTRQLDVAISKGQVLIFELDENNQPKLDKNGNPKEKAGGARDIERLLDDMQTLTAIEEGKNWSLLEQLHPKSREHIVASALGVVRPPTTKRDGTPRKKKQIVTNVDYVKMTPDARKERKFDFSTASTVYKKGGGVDLRALTPKQLEQDATIGRRRVRILRMSDRRYQRRLERGFKRREGRIYIERPESAQQRRALRRRQAVRRMQAQFRRTKSPDDAVRMVEQQRMRLHPIIFNDDDTITVDRVLPETLAGLYDVRFGDATRSTTSAENAFLQSTWESTGFMQQPILLKEREVTELMRAGWQPIIRGVSGQDAVEGEGYVEQFLTNPERFIPGQGGRMYGIGEYFTFPESADDWAGYGRGPRGTILGLLPPTSNIISANDLSTIRSQLHDTVTPVANVIGIAGGRDAMRAKTSEEVLEEFKKALPATIGERTDIGSKIIRGLFDFFEKAVIDERDNKGADTTKLRQQIIDSILLLDNLSKGQVGTHDPALGLLAPLLGFDAHVSGSVLLLHNRGALVANLEPLDKARAVEIGTIDGTRVGQVWRKFKDYVRPSGTRARKPVKDKRRPQKTSAPDDDQSISAKDAGVIDVSSWKPIPGTTAGSNGGQQFDAPDGTRYFVKPTRSDTGGTSRERAENEVLASKLYALFGIDAIDADIGATGGSVRVVSKYRADLSNARGGDERRSIQDGFAVDALLGNWDVVENDNTKMDSGTPVRTDVGGSMRFRAQGSPKGAQWNDVGEEINSMRGKGRNAGLVGPGARSYFGDITPEQIRTQVAKMMQVPEQEIRDTVASVIKDPKRAKEMADILIKRRSNIQALAANLKE